MSETTLNFGSRKDNESSFQVSPSSRWNLVSRLWKSLHEGCRSLSLQPSFAALPLYPLPS